MKNFKRQTQNSRETSNSNPQARSSEGLLSPALSSEGGEGADPHGRSVFGGKGRWAMCCVAAMAAVMLLSVGAGGRQGYVVHEWGTFTSVQGGDGVLLNWKPLETSL